MGSRALQPCHGARLASQWAWLPWSLIMRVRGASGVGRVHGMRELMRKEEEEEEKCFLFPCCTSRGRRKGNSFA